MQSVRRNCPEALKGPRSIDAKEFEVLANVAVACHARGALATRVERHDGYSVPHQKSVHTAPHLRDHSRHLMSNDLRKLNSAVHPSMKDVQVRPTNAAIRYLDLH